MSISVLSIPPTNAHHTNSCNSNRSQFVHWGTLTAQKHFVIYPYGTYDSLFPSKPPRHTSEQYCKPVFTAKQTILYRPARPPHSLPQFRSCRVWARSQWQQKKRHRPYWNYFLAAARAHNHTVPLRSSTLSITPTLSNDKTFNKLGKETFHEAVCWTTQAARHSPTKHKHILARYLSTTQLNTKHLAVAATYT